MEYPSKTIEKAVEELARLPGVGRKTALRLALHLLKCQENQVEALGNALISLKRDTRHCSRCYNLSDDALCRICAHTRRDQTVVCVVEDARDLIAIEKTNQYNGLYHVLGGTINPIAGIGPEMLNIDSLVKRMIDEPIKELILALNSSMEGETTAFYIGKKLKDFPVKISNIARGIPIGSELEFTDEITLARSIMNRTDYLVNQY